MPNPISTADAAGSGSIKNWPPGWRWHPLDGDAIARRLGAVGKRIAARDRAAGIGHRPDTAGDAERKSKVLARLERRQRRTVDGCQIKRALGLGCVLEGAAHDTKIAPTGPRSRQDPWRFSGSQLCPHLMSAAAPPSCDTEPCGQLNQQRRIDVCQQLEGGHGVFFLVAGASRIAGQCDGCLLAQSAKGCWQPA